MFIEVMEETCDSTGNDTVIKPILINTKNIVCIRSVVDCGVDEDGSEIWGAIISLSNGDEIAVDIESYTYNELIDDLQDEENNVFSSSSFWKDLRDSKYFTQIIEKFVKEIGIEMCNASYETIQYLKNFGLIK